MVDFITTNSLIFGSAVVKILVVLLIWFIGKFIVDKLVELIRFIDIKGTHVDNKLLDVLASVVSFVGRVLLVLIILDYLGIGESLITAFVGGITLMFAIAFGMAFGKALEPDAKSIVELIRTKIK